MNLYSNSKRLPMFDWNLCFFGGHSQKVPAGWYVPEDMHQAFELILVLDGIEALEMKGHKYLIKQDDFVIITPGTRHIVYSVDNLTYFCFHFNIDYPEFILRLERYNVTYYEKDSEINRIIHPFILQLLKLLNEKANDKKNEEADHKLQIQIILAQILYNLNKCFSASLPSINSDKLQIANEILENIKSLFMEQVFSPEYTESKTNFIEDAIKRADVSINYGTKLFKEAFGETPGKYLATLKRKYAEQMLSTPNFSIQTISLHLGYSSVTNFSRQFKRWTNISPSEYQKKSLL